MSRRILLGASAVVLAASGGGVVALRLADAPAPGRAAAAVSVDHGSVAAHALRALPGGARGLPAAPTEPFSLVGVTWDRPRAELRGTVKVRARALGTGTWSRWQTVPVETADAPDAPERTARGGTGGLWTGPSDGVEVRVTGHGSRHGSALPAGLRVDLVDPRRGRTVARASGTGGGVPVRLAADTGDPSDSPAPADPSAPPESPAPADSPTPADPAPEPSAPPPDPPAPSEPAPPPVEAQRTVPRPAMVSRAGWAADESIVKGPPTYDTSVKAVFVHHTDTANTATCAQSASVVRSIFLYHVKSEGWDDIGYNFLVDKCGTVFEGRAGGADKPVHGAHTYGFNTDTTGVAVLGNYESTAPAKAALDAVARVAAWKLALTGVDPNGSTTLTSMAPDGTGGKYKYGQKVSFKTVSGHRDGFATACPGAKLYAQLPAIRTAAKAITSPPPATTLSGATKSGSRYYTKGAVTLGWKSTGAASYQVRVDGAVVAKPAATETSAAVPLKAGAHTLGLRAVYADGTTADSTAYSVTADTTRPVFKTGATLAVRRGTVATTAVPVTLSWKAMDGTLLASVRATSPAARTFGATTTSWSASARPGTAQTWALTAADAAGNTASSSVARTAALVAETSATRKGKWKTTTTSSYLGGRGLYSSSKGATAKWTFTGRSVGLIVKRAKNLGAVTVYIDGKKAGTLDTRASSTAYRQLAWTKAWSSSGKHTIAVVVAGTKGRPTVGIDGIAYLR
ncbi:peptidoglycan recognition protein family protein [Actinomadura atramentaria]|uniref:peptidoglycan recognition protein family protein n=1 Tax=Actinomadura atramentaria TaxID=1990 RepID=UPI00036706E4|nr:peptidoglycan recognition protein [Actinomadura atramentaria]